MEKNRFLKKATAFMIIIAMTFFIGDYSSAKVADCKSYVKSTYGSFSGKAYKILNKNKPYFSNSQKKSKKAFEKYSALDSKGRCGVAFANVCKSLMPSEERGAIGMVKPSGWHTVKYSCVPGRYLYNRCHLIGYQLTGENANVRNLITGTRFLNMEGMLPYENKVADYVRETGNHVLYRVTPIYKGADLVARGVEMEGYSVEDKGKGICFNVFAYNAQPKVKITYSTGVSLSKYVVSGESSSSKANAYSSSSNAKGKFVIAFTTKKFHKAACRYVKQILKKNRGYFNGARKTLIKKGYVPCKVCRP